jgi:hypothetical protein
MSLVSLYDEASLWMTPSGAKDGKLFSELPTDGSGDFTFSRGSNLAATRVDANGLIEKGRENLLLQSNSFNNWTNYLTAETSGQADRNGANTAWLLEKTGGGGSIYRTHSTSGVNTFSAYVKAGTLNWVRMDFISGGSKGYFDLQNGVVGSVTGSPIDSAIEDAGNGWYRCSITTTSVGSGVGILPAENDGSVGGTSGNIYIQDAQLEQGLVATDYIETGASTAQAGVLENEPRLDYSGGASCPSLLLEPSRTNLVTQSEYFATYFSTSGTLIYNEAASPEGVQNGTKIYPTSTGSFKGLSKAFGSTLSSVPYVLSVFAKAGEFEHLYFYNVGSPNGANGVWFNLTTGSVGTNQAAWTSAKMEDFGNGWYRCSAVITPGGSSDNLYILLADSNGSVTATTNGTDGFYIYGAQLEQGSYPTSYIPNHSGGSVTRGADNSYTGTISGVIGQTQGVVFCEFIYRAFAEDMRMGISDGTSANYNNIRITSGGTLYVLGAASSVLQYEINAGSLTDSQTYKVALKYNTNDIEVFVNGVSKGTDTTATIGVCNRFGFDNRAAGANPFYSDIKQTLLFPTALTDSECIALTKLG